MKKGSLVIGIGMLIFSIVLFLEHAFGISGNVTDFIMGLGIGVELAGVVLLVFFEKRGKHKKKPFSKH